MVTTHADGLTLLEMHGSLPEAVDTANEALRRALFHDPRAVACDLSAVAGQLDESALEQLVDTGGLLEHWPGTRLAVLPNDGGVRGLTIGSPAGSYLVGTTVPETLQALSASPPRTTARIMLEPHPRASRTARDFVTRTCLDWRCPHSIPAAVLVVSELVTNALRHAGTPLEVSLSTAGSRLLLTVHDGNDEPPRVLRAVAEQGRGRGMHVVRGYSRAWGSLPGPDGGKSVWVVLDA